MHRLLERQLRKLEGSADLAPSDWAAFLRLVDDAYTQADQDHKLIERSLELVSAELVEHNEELRIEFDRRAREQAAQSEARTRALLAGLPDQLFRIGIDGRVLDFHSGEPEDAVALPEEISGRSLWSVFPDQVARDIRRALDRALETDQPQLLEFELDVPRGRQSFEARVARVGPQELLLILRNITEQILLEERLRTADRMSSLGTLAAGVAHEINNPLAYVLANLTLIQQALAGFERTGRASELGEAREALDDALEGAERVRIIVRDLKAFTRTDAEQPRSVEVREAIQQAVHLVGKPLLHRALVRWEVEDVPPVLATEARLGQVLVNLLVNAVHALYDTAERSHEVVLAARTSRPGFVAIEVRDTGRGMDLETRKKAFEPFFTTRRSAGGTGLGLFLCHRIVQQFGGTIDVSSTPGHGTTVVVELPSARPALATMSEESESSIPVARKGRVLVVDDEPMVLRTLARVLKRHDVHTVGSGTEALACLAEESWDLVLCDLMMPGCTGMDVYDHLATTRPQLLDRMVFMTGGTFSERARCFLEEVPNTRLEKPFDLRRLRAVVQDKLMRARSTGTG